MDHIEAIEPNFHARVMNLQIKMQDSMRDAATDRELLAYKVGHRDARHAAAEIAAEADAQIAALLDRLREAEADARRWRTFLNTRPASTHEVIRDAIDAATKEAP